MNYPTVTVKRQPNSMMAFSLPTTLQSLTLNEGTYALVPLPEGERGVFIVTEGGEWPEDALVSLTLHREGGFALTPSQVFDALAKPTEGSG